MPTVTLRANPLYCLFGSGDILIGVASDPDSGRSPALAFIEDEPGEVGRTEHKLDGLRLSETSPFLVMGFPSVESFDGVMGSFAEYRKALVAFHEANPDA